MPLMEVKPVIRKLTPREGEEDKGEWCFHCPGCKHGHSVTTKGKNRVGAQWTWNGDTVRPTFKPSLLITMDGPGTEHVCHSFVTNGEIRFLDDCKHELAGKTVKLEPF